MTTFLSKKNNAKTTLYYDVGASSGTVVVVNASLFPTANFIVTLWDKSSYSDPSDDPGMEIALVTTVSGSNFTVTRGQESTVGTSHLAGHACEMLITKGHFDEYEISINTSVYSRFKYHVVPTPTPNGTITTFQTPVAYLSNSLQVFRDQLGLRVGIISSGADAQEINGTTFQVASAPDSDEVLWVNYITNS